MNYTIRAGALYSQPEEKQLAQLKGGFGSQGKDVLSAEGMLMLRTEIRRVQDSAARAGDVRGREYVLLDADGAERAVARPDYAGEDDPDKNGWPVCRLPHVDHARLYLGGKSYLLSTQNSQSYSLADSSGKIVVRIFHRGVMGGWNIEAGREFAAEDLCGLFVFCKYMERENEFLTV